MLRLALRTGLRYSEIIALTWEDVDLDRRVVCVRRSEVRGHIAIPKSNRIRHVPLTGDAVATLRGIERHGGPVFLRHGRSVCYVSASRYLARACSVADIRPITWHGLRHTFASSLAMRGASIYAIQALLGHSTVEMTQRYAHLSTNALHTTVSLLEPQEKNPGSRLSTDFSETPE